MKKIILMKRIILRVIYVLISIIAIASIIAYFILVKDREWMAFYIACCGGVLVINLVVIAFLVRKNFKE
jgi:hypothetical protein